MIIIKILRKCYLYNLPAIMYCPVDGQIKINTNTYSFNFVYVYNIDKQITLSIYFNIIYNVLYYISGKLLLI
jgi:hypothetical protein